MKRRILSILTVLALCLSLCPSWAFAEEALPEETQEENQKETRKEAPDEPPEEAPDELPQETWNDTAVTDAGEHRVYYKVEGSRNYEAVGPLSIQVPIWQASCPDLAGQMLYIQNGKTADYTLDLEQFAPLPPFGHFGAENSDPAIIDKPAIGGDWGYNITDSNYFTKDNIKCDNWTLKVSVNAVNTTDERGVAVITVKYTSNNFLPFGLPLTIKSVNKIPVNITGVETRGWTYDGKAHPGCSGTPSSGACTGVLTVTYLDEDGNPPPGGGTVRVTGITLDKTSLTLTGDESAQLTAAVQPANASSKTVVWSSSDPSVAEVDGEGKVTARAPGTAVITATTRDGGFAASCTVTVTGKRCAVTYNPTAAAAPCPPEAP